MKITTVDHINKLIKTEGIDANLVSDGYHTFGELYEHRIALFIVLCNYLHVRTDKYVWKSRKHSDGTEMEGWFIAGIGSDKNKQLSYHLPISKFYDLHAPELKFAPEWDGHTPEDVIKRLYEL